MVLPLLTYRSAAALLSTKISSQPDGLVKTDLSVPPRRGASVAPPVTAARSAATRGTPREPAILAVAAALVELGGEDPHVAEGPLGVFRALTRVVGPLAKLDMATPPNRLNLELGFPPGRPAQSGLELAPQEQHWPRRRDPGAE